VNRSLRILLIEDNPGDADLLEDMLTGAGLRFELKCVERLSAGIEHIRADGFDVILLDLGLPDSQGLATLKKLNEIRPKAPVIVLTGLADEAVGTQAVKEGAQDYLIKGQIEKNLLARSIQYAIERTRLEAEREQYFKFFQTSADLMCFSDPKGAFIKTNPAFMETLGYTEAELTSRPFIDFVHPEDRQTTLDEMTSQMQKGFTINFENRYVCKDGSLRWLAWRAIYNRNEGITYATARDITYRKQAEEELKRLTHKIGLILNSAGEGIYGVDLEGKVTFINPAAARILGYEVVELLGKESHATWHHHTPDETVLPVEACTLNEVLIAGTPGAAENAVFWKKDGTRIPIEYSSTPMFEDHKLVGAVVIFKDITSRLFEEQEKNKLSNQLRHAQKLEGIGQLAGGIAHDFNNVLNAVVGYAGLLQMQMDAADPLRKFVDEIASAGMRGAALTQQILAFSRKQVLDMKPANLNEIIKGLEKMLHRLVREDISIEINLFSNDLIVLADASQIDQILINLATNARDAMPSGGSLRIATEFFVMDENYVAMHGYGNAGDYALLTVSDTGCGMDADTVSHIFEPFFTTKEVGKGTGLGLAVVHGLVKQHNGFISVYSEVGNGTVFKIFLPLTEYEEEEKDEKPVGGIVGGTETILIAEDDAPLRRLSSVILRNAGYTVIEAVDGEDALRKFADNREKIGLVILDGIMPKKNGKEVYAEITRTWPGVKAIFMSGYAEEIFTRGGIPDKGVVFISKPVKPDDMLRKVREVLDNKIL